MAGIRTVVVTMSPLLAGIIEESMSPRLTLDVVARFAARDFSEQRLRDISPDLILVGLGPGEADGVARSLLALAPLAKVIALSSDARRGYVHEMRPRRAVLTDLSPQALVSELVGPIWRRSRSSRRQD